MLRTLGCLCFRKSSNFLGLRIWGLGFIGFRIEDNGFKVEGLAYGVEGLEFSA